MRDFLRAIRRISSAGLNSSLKRKIIRTIVRLFLTKVFRGGQAGRMDGGHLDLAGDRFSYLSFDSFEYAFNEIFVNLDYFFQTDEEEPLIIDCGSNIGLSVAFFKKLYPAAEVIAFEPNSQAFSVLQENARQNNWQKVHLHQKALSDQSGIVDLYFDPQSSGSLKMSLIRERVTGMAESVEAVVLSSFIDREVDFLKLDVEGAEERVLRDLCRAGKLRSIKEIVIEYHHHIEARKDTFSDMLRQLEDNGFGYLVDGQFGGPLITKQGMFQDIRVYAYRKASHG